MLIVSFWHNAFKNRYVTDPYPTWMFFTHSVRCQVRDCQRNMQDILLMSLVKDINQRRKRTGFHVLKNVLFVGNILVAIQKPISVIGLYLLAKNLKYLALQRLSKISKILIERSSFFLNKERTNKMVTFTHSSEFQTKIDLQIT